MGTVGFTEHRRVSTEGVYKSVYCHDSINFPIQEVKQIPSSDITRASINDTVYAHTTNSILGRTMISVAESLIMCSVDKNAYWRRI